MSRLKLVSLTLLVISVVLTGVYFVSGRGKVNTSAPEIAMDSEVVEVSVNDGEQALLKGVTATDVQDGDVTDSLLVESVGSFMKNGHRIVTYAVMDSDRNVAHGQREVAYSDYVKPQFIMYAPLSFAVGTTNLRNAIRAMDCLDGDITSEIRLVSEQGIDVTLPGNYSAELRVANSSGDTSVLPVTVEIYNSQGGTKAATIELSEYVTYITQGAKFDANAYLISLKILGTTYSFTKGTETYGTMDAAPGINTVSYERVTVQSNVNTAQAGNYEVKYIFSDAENGTAIATLYVVVMEGGAK